MSPAVGPAPGSKASCDHGDVTFGIDPDPVYLRHCQETVDFWAPIEAVPGPIGLCPYHLARYLEDVDDRLEAELVERGAREHVDGGFVTIDEAPPLFVTEDDGVTKVWSRAAIDQRGRAHYQRPEEEVALRLDGGLDEDFAEFGPGGFPGYMEAIRETVGFAAFDEDLSIPTGAADPEDSFQADDRDQEVVTDGGCVCVFADVDDLEDGLPEQCMTEGPNGYVCTRPPDHDGKHVACDWLQSHRIDEWADQEIATDGGQDADPEQEALEALVDSSAGAASKLVNDVDLDDLPIEVLEETHDVVTAIRKLRESAQAARDLDEPELVTDGGRDDLAIEHRHRDADPEEWKRRLFEPRVYDEEPVSDGGVVDLRELPEGPRAALFGVRELEGDDAVLVDPNDLAEHLEDDPNGASQLHLRNNVLPDLEEQGLLYGEKVPKRGQRDPRWYATTDLGQASLEAFVSRLAEQIGRAVSKPGSARAGRPDLDADPIDMDGWQTVLERDERSDDRVVDEPFCIRCGSVYAGEGLCESCEDNVEDELVADGGQSHEDFDQLVGADDVDRPAWAARYDVGDVVTFECRRGVFRERVIGFSTKRELEGQPAVLIPDGLQDLFPPRAKLLVLREQDLVTDPAIETDGGGYRCDLCGGRHPTLGDAARCCSDSDRFTGDHDLATDGGKDRTIVDAGDRVGVGLDAGDAQASIVVPKDASPRQVVRLLDRLEKVARNELAYRQRSGDLDEDSEDTFRDELEDDQDDDGTEYGRQGVGEEALTDGGRDPVDFDELLTVCQHVEEDDEIDLETGSYDYSAPLEVAEVTVVEWLGGGWRTARLVLEGVRGGEHKIVGVEGDAAVRDFVGEYPLLVYQLDPVGVELPDEPDDDPDSPLASEDSPHKYTTNGALDDLERTGADDEEELNPLEDGEGRPWSELGVSPPTDLTAADLEAAVENSDRLYDVCRELGLRPTDRGMVRVLLVNEGLYRDLDMPEARQRPAGAEEELATDGGEELSDPASATPNAGLADDVDGVGTNVPRRRTSPTDDIFQADDREEPEDSFRNRDVEKPEDSFRGEQRDLGPAHRLGQIAKQARLLRYELDLEQGDAPELAGITAAAMRIAERHDLEIDSGRVDLGGGDPGA